MIGLRALLIGIGATLGIALVAHGNYVIGGLILAAAVVRTIMVVRFHHVRGRRLARRAGVRARVAERRTSPEAGSRPR